MSAMYEFVICDVFTERPLAGNQLAVFLDGALVPEALLAPLAQEIHFSETVYVYPPERGGTARIRIFTPAGEIPFAGHPTLGSGALVARRERLDEIVLETGKGPVPVSLTLSGEYAASGWMRQPIPTVTPYSDTRLLPALGVERSLLPIELYDLGMRYIYVALPDEAAVAALSPDLATLAALGEVGVSCFAGSGRRWKTRMFAPGHGVAEDPATGSAAGPLACHLARHGRIPFGTEIEISQGVELGRPSRLLARVEGTRDRIARVEVGGSMVVVGEGAFRKDLPVSRC
jgi:trans-2,3-dihydro-3-hydroxyanthranilate isomerase